MLKPIKRTAIDGKVWWVPWDCQEHSYSTLLCFGKYKTKRECELAIKISGLKMDHYWRWTKN